MFYLVVSHSNGDLIDVAECSDGIDQALGLIANYFAHPEEDYAATYDVIADMWCEYVTAHETGRGFSVTRRGITCATFSDEDRQANVDRLAVAWRDSWLSDPPVVFNMHLANGPTSERFCIEAMQVLETTMSNEDARELAHQGEHADEVVTEWTDRLEQAGYAVRWDCGDVVVYDVRNLTPEQLDTFYDELDG